MKGVFFMCVLALYVILVFFILRSSAESVIEDDDGRREVEGTVREDLDWANYFQSLPVVFLVKGRVEEGNSRVDFWSNMWRGQFWVLVILVILVGAQAASTKKKNGKGKEEIALTEAKEESKDETPEVVEEATAVTESEKSTYLGERIDNPMIVRVQNLLKRILEIIGVRKSGNRRNRMIEMDGGNSLEETYDENVRTTVGALLGKNECLKRAACGAGTYLRHIKGKEILLVILEKVSPNTWTETVDVMKKAAVYKHECSYKCLED